MPSIPFNDGHAFELSVVSRLSKELLLAVASREIGALRVPSFIDPHTSEAVLTAIGDSLLERYDPENYESAAYRFGPTLNEHRQDGTIRSSYWDRAEEARATWNERLKHAQLREECLDKLSSAWDGLVEPATVSGLALFWGIIREISNGTLVHWDDVTLEFPDGIFDRPPTAQLALNVFLSVSTEGGETLIWPRQWSPSDEAYRVGFGYRSAVMGNQRALSIKASSEDAILFNPSNYHAVNRGWGGRRIAFAAFVGVCDDRLVLWS
jgi:hypothetical protein